MIVVSYVTSTSMYITKIVGSSVLFSMNKYSFKDAGQEPKGFSVNNDGRKSFRSGGKVGGWREELK